MNLHLTAQIHADGKWFVAFCPEIPEANGQGLTQEECLKNLQESIELLLEDRREDAEKSLPHNAKLLPLEIA
ncbi:MAG: type II toxin-antitoxin system HicB family antitoxin [Verrucomicrobiae bacterium]|nr:type II toxin-antitoxin system HicB family antitoxin [Verrucomicrobiae bacterium]